MSADFAPQPPRDATFDRSVLDVDPVAHFNEVSSHTAPQEPQSEWRTLQLDGDPAAKEEILAAIEAAGGQIPFSQYMDLALYGAGGYYSQGKVQFQGRSAGDAGDFFTSPEQSADFSRAMNVGVCAILCAMGMRPFNLVELGAGSGRMFKDVLASMRNEYRVAYDHVSGYVADYGGMRPRQQRTIGSSERAHPGSYAAMSTPEEHRQDLAKVQWVPGSALNLALDNGKPTIVMANEVPDAVCADVVRNNNGVLEQKFVGATDGKLDERWLPLTDKVRDYVATYGTTIEPGKEVAISTDAVALQRSVCRMITHGGFISVDYGAFGPSPRPSIPWKPKPLKMQHGYPLGQWYEHGAVRTYPNNFHPLEMPGELDLTSDPDFAVLQRVSKEEGMRVEFAGTQKDFLQICGLPSIENLEAISEVPGLTPESIRRIRDAQALGSTGFKALVVTRGVEADFTARRAMLRGYREFYY